MGAENELPRVFTHKVHNMIFVVERSRKLLVDGELQNFPGIKVFFFGGQFDADEAQHRFSWTDEQRDKAIRFLLGHKEFGRSLTLKPTLDDVDVSSIPAGCLFFTKVDGKSEQCGLDTEGGPFCAKHSAIVERAEENAEKGARLAAGRQAKQTAGV